MLADSLVADSLVADSLVEDYDVADLLERLTEACVRLLGVTAAGLHAERPARPSHHRRVLE